METQLLEPVSPTSEKISNSMVPMDSIDLVNCLNNEFTNGICEFIKDIKSKHHQYFMISDRINAIAEIIQDEFNIIYLYDKDIKALYVIYSSLDNKEMYCMFAFALENEDGINKLHIEFESPKKFTLLLK